MYGERITSIVHMQDDPLLSFGVFVDIVNKILKELYDTVISKASLPVTGTRHRRLRHFLVSFLAPCQRENICPCANQGCIDEDGGFNMGCPVKPRDQVAQALDRNFDGTPLHSLKVWERFELPSGRERRSEGTCLGSGTKL